MKDEDKLGAKHDGGKLLFRALTRGLALPLRAVAAVLTYGAQKYDEDSWRTVPNGEQRYESALDRHLNEWKLAEGRQDMEFDEESGLHHLAHVACNALFLLWYRMMAMPGRNFFLFKKPPPKVQKLDAVLQDFTKMSKCGCGICKQYEEYPPHK